MKLFFVLYAVSINAMLAAAESTINPDDRHAYGANVGWIDARGDVATGAVIGQHFCSGMLWCANVGWISLGAGAPSNGWSYANDSPADWGVNHDGAGNLTGFAYGANVGWIAFEQTHGQPRVDLRTGALSGYAWGANIGWISLANSQALVRTDTLGTGPDSDGDGIPDAWEWKIAGNLAGLAGAGADQDQDGVPDVDEFIADTDPFDNASYLTITAFSRAAGTDEIIWSTQPTRLYRLLQTDSLLPSPPVWSDSGLGLVAPLGSSLSAQIIDPAATQRFYRVQAILPLTP